MRMDANSSIEQPDDPAPLHKHERNLRADPEDQSWTFLPVIIAPAAACLLLYFFLKPAFYVGAASPTARSARPGAATQTTPRKPQQETLTKTYERGP
jgi:hypothetical protein